ncbi:MAG TPA: prolyl aminopeptidase [Burkholderiaceae bacterium]|nr:prolyl aminopeptidase [Burkholderiaceae bacterium]
MDARADLYAPIEPYDTGMLTLDGVHTMYWETSGNPRGVPVVFLHGGPGGGSAPEHRRFFDPAFFRVVLYDQRGAGASTPFAEIAHNTTQHLVADLERLREHLGISRWLLFGGSWGSTLALAYGQTHPQRCLGFVLRGVFLGRASEVHWFFHGARQIHPEAWRKFVEMLPEAERGDLLAGYRRRLFNIDPKIHMPFARAWSEYEGTCSTLVPNPELVREFSDDALALARLEAHFFAHHCFLAPNQLLTNLYRIQHLPASIVHSRYDVVCPIVSADELARAWPGARYTVVPDAGHSVWEPSVRAAVVREVELFKRRLAPLAGSQTLRTVSRAR